MLQDFRSSEPNTGKRFLENTGRREEELRARLESEGGSDGLTAWQEVAVRGSKTSEGMYEEARKRWEEMKELDLPMEEDFSVVCTNLDWALCEAEKQQRGREVKVYEQWREEREEQGLSGWWGDWLREGRECMEVEVEVDWDKVLSPPPMPEWLVKQKRKEEYEDWEKARKDTKCRRWRNKYAREQREIAERERKVNDARLRTVWIEMMWALREDRLEEAIKLEKEVFDLARLLGRFDILELTPLTSQKEIMDKLAEQRAAMPKPDPAEMQEPMEYPEYPDISLWTDYECFDASSGSEDFDLEEFDYPDRNIKPRKQKPKPQPQPQSKPKYFSLSCSPPKNLTSLPKPRPEPRPVKILPPLPEVPPSAYELLRLDRQEEIKAKFLELFGEHMTKNSFRRVDWSRVLGRGGLPDGSDDE